MTRTEQIEKRLEILKILDQNRKKQIVEIKNIINNHGEQLEKVLPVLESKIENFEKLESTFSQRLDEIFSAENLNFIKSQFLQQVHDDAQEIVTNNVNKVVADKTEETISNTLKDLILKNSEGKLDEKFLDKFTENVVDAILPMLISKDIFERDVEEEKEEIKPFDPENELVHYNFEKLLEVVKVGLAPMLVGPAGTGKSTAAEQVARVLNLPFYMANRVSQAYELTGYNDAQGRYVQTPFYKAYKNGGVFMFDEIDGSDPEALVTINTAIAQGYNVFCGEKVNKHPNFKLIAAGNTYGTGPNSEYCGRNQLDSATLDRFVVIPWGYDKSVEAKLVQNKELLKFSWALRRVIDKNNLKIIISTRGIMAVNKLINSETISLAENLQYNFFEGATPDTLNLIKSGLTKLTNISSSSPYIKAIDDILASYREQSYGGRE